MDERAVAPKLTRRRTGRIQVRVTLAIVAILVPLMIAAAWITVYFQRQEMEGLLLEKAESIARSGAVNIGNLWESAIANGELTREQVFDTNYVRFWTFDPATYPDFEDDPRSLDKYHTQYDAYTDARWQELLDVYLSTEDIIFAVVQDVNGYIPTHNRRWSSGDGNPATDRTKRIFNDSVGIAASRNTEPVLRQVYRQAGTGETLWDVSSPIYVYGEHWGVFRVGMELTQNQARVAAALWRTIFIMGAIVLATAGVALGIGRYVAVPITRLTEAATRMAGGELDQQVDIPNRDEITVLAQALNTMAAQLRQTLTGLEQRVAERTAALAQRAALLEAASEVSRTTTEIVDIGSLLNQVVNLVQRRFDLYYVGLFLVDEVGRQAVLRAGTGIPGQEMMAQGWQLEVGGQSMIGQCVVTGQADIQLDVGEAAVRFQNPHLPQTRSEMALPLRARGEVIGAMTIQSDRPAAFSQDDIRTMQTMADQVAVAISNARLFQQVQDSLEAERQRYSEQTRGAWRELAHTEAGLGYLSDRRHVAPLGDFWRPEMKVAVRSGQVTAGEREDTVAIPLIVRDQVVGVLGGRKPNGAAWTPEEIDLFTAMTEQLTEALEGAQLYRETQRAAARERIIGQVSGRIRQELDLEAVLKTTVDQIQQALGLEKAAIRLVGDAGQKSAE